MIDRTRGRHPQQHGVGVARRTAVVSQCAIVFAVATRTKTTPMPKYFGALTIVILLGMVLTRVFLLKRQQSHEAREHRQDRFPDSASCPVLFLSPVRRRVRLA